MTRGQVGSVGASIGHRHAEALSVSDYDICAKFTGWFKQAQRQQIRGDSHNGFSLMCQFYHTGYVKYSPG